LLILSFSLSDIDRVVVRRLLFAGGLSDCPVVHRRTSVLPFYRSRYPKPCFSDFPEKNFLTRLLCLYTGLGIRNGDFPIFGEKFLEKLQGGFCFYKETMKIFGKILAGNRNLAVLDT
jgi:hypothetical protein